MKKLLLFTLCLVGYSYVASAQVIYTPFYPNQQQSTNQSQSQIQTIRTTAYYIDSYSGRINRVQIKVREQDDAWGNAGYSVVEYYIDSGIGGQWHRMINPSTISKCNSMFASNSLEQRCMYKAFFNTQTHYFDL